MKKGLIYQLSMVAMFLCTINMYAQESKSQTKSFTKSDSKSVGDKDSKFSKMTYDYNYEKGKTERSELQLSKSFSGETLSTTKTFDVEPSAENLFIALAGNAKSGKISIKFIQPDGKEYKTFEIDPTSDVRWENNINLTEKKEKMNGEWKIQINIDKAEGSYGVRVSTR